MEALQSATGVSLDGKMKQTQVGSSRCAASDWDAVSRAYSFAALTLSRYILQATSSDWTRRVYQTWLMATSATVF